ncbi:MAG: pyridoxal 5'-phosphate synthase glutaminase subunit PdxT [Thermoanaerobaculales bacterium]|jgi:5'-phosphate synthase pdxT subunit|nr:pyridoxal 5'-phosphate synthase glutaminase subunit PdxT [Thermoanaerobaculales bacterium]
MRCGVLALQGDWAAHLAVLDRLGTAGLAVRSAADLAAVEALVLPGGESTAMLRLMEAERLDERIADRIDHGMPVLATCAGVILLARRCEPDQPSLDRLDVDVARNAFGRQVHSRVATVELAAALGPPPRLDGVFIRAPRILRAGPGVEVLGRLDGEPVLLRQGGILAATFHPELTGDLRVHRMLVDRGAHDGR